MALGLVCVTCDRRVERRRRRPVRTFARHSRASTPPESPPIQDTPTSAPIPEVYAIQHSSRDRVRAGAQLSPPHRWPTPSTRRRGRAFPTRSILLSWTENSDVATVDGVRPLITSADRGYTFPSAQYTAA